MTKKRIPITGMHCASCSLLIEGELGDIGVEAVCDYAKGYVDVLFDEKRVSEQQMREVITKLGYGVPREPEKDNQ